MLFGDRAARLRVGHYRRVAQLGKACELRSRLREPYSAAGKDRRALGLVQPFERLRQRGSAGTGGLLEPIFRKLDSLLIDACEQHVNRQFQEYRPGTAGCRVTECGCQVLWNPLGMRDAARPLGDWPQDAHLIDGLQRQLVIVGERTSPADQNHRDRVHERVGHPRYRVGDAWSRGHNSDARTPRRASPSVSHVCRRLLVTSIDHAEAVSTAGRVNRIEMATMQRENFVNTLVLERPYQHLAAVDLCHW